MSLLADILASEEVRLDEFPVARRKTFLAHAAVCPLPRRVVRAVCEHAERAGQEGQFEHLHRREEQGCRDLAAGMLGASPDEIAFLSSTSAGLSMVAEGLPWQAGDSVLVAASDFPSNLHPWLALRRRQVDVRFAPRSPDGSVGIADLEPLIDRSTRLVALSSAHFGIGTPIEIDAIGSFLRSRGVLFCVDGIQTFGAHPLRATHVDFMAADAHKWLLGPQGIGILYVRSEHFERLRPILSGWKSVASSKDYGSLDQAFAPSARRYEPGSLNASGICGLHAALRILSSDSAAISDRIRALRAHAESGLRQAGHEVLGRPGEPQPTGIVSFRPRNGETETVARRLDGEGIVVSVRNDIEGRSCIRVAPHFYNTHPEIDRLLAAV